jgi:hypothetical protein
VNVRDALSDLPVIKSGASNNKIALNEPISDYQRRCRKGNLKMSTITDHICKDVPPLVLARVGKIKSILVIMTNSYG